MWTYMKTSFDSPSNYYAREQSLVYNTNIAR